MTDTTKALYDAIFDNQLETIRSLIKKGADVNAVAVNTGIAPLHWAVQLNRIDAISILLEAGADIDARDRDYETPLHSACRYADPGRAAIACLLLERGADAGAHRHDGKTPLGVATKLPEGNEARKMIIEWYREHRPDLTLETYCTMGPRI